jgi:hypothetical protein
MAEYEKVTPAKFRKRLKEGHYETLTGARRAIGRMSEWTDQQKNRARNEAEKYFDGAPAPKAKKAAKKKVAKKTTKKAAKKVTKKKATKKKAAKKGPLARHHARNKRKAAAKKKAARKSAPVSQMTSVQQANMQVGTIDQALQSMRTARELGADETEVAKGAKKAQQALTAIVEELCGTVSQSNLSDEEQAAAESLAVAAATGAGPNGQKGQPASSPGVAAPVVPPAPTVPAET